MPNIGPVELIILVVILLLVFGSRKLPELGRSLGSGMREFKDSVTGRDENEKKSLDSDAGTGTGTNTDDDD
jgi:sec-independent protein translocase protein TatA